MRHFVFFLIAALICVFFMEGEAASRIRRDDTLDTIQQKLSETFEAFKKTAEEIASKMDIQQLQKDFNSKVDEIAKSFNEYTSGGEKKPE